ncbi:hypothetical protein [Bradyrhizobium yuanmingense]|uniref:hypothetical protein n=1 Tax=Bradyrhizobium yuanmingense TaxID=108015 RepID=UPI0023BA1A69|nr:hypothetical protein [Bradyrhizobium yuanmingense]MDF0578882.1 hypothetical protein [Bradyrhizobium yuanmingense]
MADAFEIWKTWLRAKLALISQNIELAEAICYALSRRQRLTRLMDTGASNSTTTQSNDRSAASSLSRNNALLAGCDGGAEHGGALRRLDTCEFNDVDAIAYITDALKDRQRLSQSLHRPPSALGLSRPSLKAVARERRLRLTRWGINMGIE